MIAYLIGCGVVILCIVIDAMFCTPNKERFMDVEDLLIAIAITAMSWISTILCIWYFCAEHVKWNKITNWWNKFKDIIILDWRK